MIHKTPSKVTIEFADGTSKVFDSTTVGSSNNNIRHVLEIAVYPADQDSGSSAANDQHYTGVLFHHPFGG
jgi:hypothetical protein